MQLDLSIHFCRVTLDDVTVAHYSNLLTAADHATILFHKRLGIGEIEVHANGNTFTIRQLLNLTGCSPIHAGSLADRMMAEDHQLE